MSEYSSVKYCLSCNKILTFVSEKNKKYNYHRKCWNKLKKEGNLECSCRCGFRRKCEFYTLCKSYTEFCKTCGNNFIDEYCDWCK
jgi:hypothetical protein